nr:response regulator transcription factor [Amycolatopsis sp. CA-230715]
MIFLLEEHGFEIAAAVASGPELANALAEQNPDLAIVDVRLPPTFTDEGLKVALAARRERPGLPVLVLSQHVEQLYARELLADGAGAVGYLLKDRVFNAEQFVDAVRRVAEGGTAMDPKVIATLLADPERDDPLASLTEREREVLGLMAEGLSNTAIAQRLSLSEGAISKHTTSLFGKLRIEAGTDTNRRVLAVLAYLHGR